MIFAFALYTMVLCVCFKDLIRTGCLSPSKRGNLLEDLVLMVPKVSDTKVAWRVSDISSYEEVTDKG